MLVLQHGQSFDSIRNIGLISRDGLEIYISGNAVAIHNETGSISGVVISFKDITREYEQEKEIEGFLNVNLDLLCVSNLEGQFVKVNQKFEEVLGYTTAEISYQYFTDYIHPEDIEATHAAMEVLAGGGMITGFVNRYRCKNGTYKYIEWRSQPGNGRYIYSSARDVTARTERENEILYLSYHDSLTGLHNRRFMVEEFKRLDNPANLPISIIIGDVNRLKLVNDTLGHEKGDELLILAARTIQAGCRPGDQIARWGGDEFIIGLPRTGADEAARIIARIETLCQGRLIDSYPLSISLGYATKTSSGETINETLRRADTLMYQNKHSQLTESEQQ